MCLDVDRKLDRFDVDKYHTRVAHAIGGMAQRINARIKRKPGMYMIQGPAAEEADLLILRILGMYVTFLNSPGVDVFIERTLMKTTDTSQFSVSAALAQGGQSHLGIPSASRTFVEPRNSTVGVIIFL